MYNRLQSFQRLSGINLAIIVSIVDVSFFSATFQKMIKSIGICFFLLSVWEAPLSAQETPEFIITDTGDFVGSHCFNTIAKFDNNHLAAISSGMGFDSANVVKISDDGGKTWKNIKYDKNYNINPITFQPLPGDWKERWYYSIARPQKNILIVLAADRPKNDPSGDFVYGSQRPYILRTTDLGKSWNTISITDSISFSSTNALSMANELVGYIISGSSLATANTGMTLYKTTDAGATWNPISNPFSASWVLSLQALSDKEIVVVTSDSIYKSSDGGIQWDKTAKVPNHYRFFFQSLSVGYCTGGIQTGVGQQETTTAYKTADGGKTWIKILDTIGNGVSGKSINFFDDKNGFILASDAYWQTSDGGITWRQVQPPYGIIYNASKSVTMTSPTTSVILMDNYIIHQTGRMLLARPTLSWKKKDTFNYTLTWDKIFGASKYKIQIARRVISSDLIIYDFNIFNTKDEIIDTVVDGLAFTVPQLDADKDYFARIIALGDTLNSDWSNQTILRTPSKTMDILSAPNPILPSNNQIVNTTKVLFKWVGDSRATRYSLLLTTKGTTEEAFHDSVAHNIYGILTDSVIVELSPNQTYFWVVRAWGPGFDSAVSSFYHTFSIQSPSAVDAMTVFVEPHKNWILGPNPCKDHLTFQVPDNTTSIQIYNPDGQMLIDRTLQDNSGGFYNVSLTDIPNGFYLAMIRSTNGMVDAKPFILMR